MRKIGIKQLKNNLSKELRELPFQITLKGEVVATVDGVPVKAQIKGIIRGILRDGTDVWKGMKAGDIDARGVRESCYTVSDKTMAIGGGGVLEGILSYFNQ